MAVKRRQFFFQMSGTLDAIEIKCGKGIDIKIWRSRLVLSLACVKKGGEKERERGGLKNSGNSIKKMVCFTMFHLVKEFRGHVQFTFEVHCIAFKLIG